MNRLYFGAASTRFNSSERPSQLLQHPLQFGRHPIEVQHHRLRRISHLPDQLVLWSTREVRLVTGEAAHLVSKTAQSAWKRVRAALPHRGDHHRQRRRRTAPRCDCGADTYSILRKSCTSSGLRVPRKSCPLACLRMRDRANPQQLLRSDRINRRAVYTMLIQFCHPACLHM